MAPDETASGVRYTLYLEGRVGPGIPQRLDALLRKKPHYALCRDLGQLQAPALFHITAGGYETFAEVRSKGNRLGDLKSCSLSLHAGWSNRFNGDYSAWEPSMNATA